MVILKIIFGILICVPFIYFLIWLFSKFVAEIAPEPKKKTRKK